MSQSLTQGYRFPDSRLTFQKYLPDVFSGRQRKRVVECSCECGKTMSCLLASIQCGDTRSCGCLRDDLADIRLNTTKDNSARHSSIYKCWNNVKQRCNNPKNPNYKNYGAKGITVTSKWDKFKDFQQWAEANGYQKDLTLERRDSTKNYTPENCTWTSHKTQCQNMKKSCWWVIDNVAFDSIRDAACHHQTSQYYIQKWIDTKADCFKIPKYKNECPSKLPTNIKHWSAVYKSFKR